MAPPEMVSACDADGIPFTELWYPAQQSHLFGNF